MNIQYTYIIRYLDQIRSVRKNKNYPPEAIAGKCLELVRQVSLFCCSARRLNRYPPQHNPQHCIFIIIGRLQYCSLFNHLFYHSIQSSAAIFVIIFFSPRLKISLIVYARMKHLLQISFSVWTYVRLSVYSSVSSLIGNRFPRNTCCPVIHSWWHWIHLVYCDKLPAWQCLRETQPRVMYSHSTAAQG